MLAERWALVTVRFSLPLALWRRRRDDGDGREGRGERGGRESGEGEQGWERGEGKGRGGSGRGRKREREMGIVETSITCWVLVNR